MQIKRLGSRAGALVAVVAVSSMLAGCTPVVKNSDVEQQITEKLSQAGEKPDKVDCPDDLKGKTGATGHCTVTIGGVDTGFTVVVTKVKGNTVNFDIRPDAVED